MIDYVLCVSFNSKVPCLFFCFLKNKLYWDRISLGMQGWFNTWKSSNVIYHIYRIKRKSYHLNRCRKKHLTKFSPYSWQKHKSELLHLWKTSNKNLQLTSYLMVKDWMNDPLRSWTNLGYPLSPILVNIVLGSSPLE